MKEEEKKREAEESLKRGKEGKGIKDDYVRFCKGCFREFQIDCEKCYVCGSNTITKEERIEDIKSKALVYQEKKKRKMERKAKWERWVKTQAMFYNKTSTNYKKWDYYTSSEEEEPETDPILPEDNPQFKAMEADIMERRKRRMRDKKEATELKDKGNECMKKGLWKTAHKYYSDAIELKKDMMPLYSNRALARLKLEDF